LSTFTTAPARLPAPLAEGATVATRPAGRCSLCRQPIVTFERYASLVPSGAIAHVRCIGQPAGAGRAAPR